MHEGRVFIPLVTPLTDSDQVCERSVEQLVARTKQSVSGYIPCLTSGEGWLLSEQQWLAMVRSTVSSAGGMPVIAGVERPSTDEVVRYAREAEKLGAQGIMITSPFGGEIEQSTIMEHYRRVHDGCGTEVYIYNESSLSGNETDFTTLMEIAGLQRVVGIKDSVEGGRSVPQIRALQGQGLSYFVGWEQLLAKGLPADGNVVSLSNLDATLCRLGNQTDAMVVQAEIARLCEVYSLDAPDWYRYVKQALKAWGVISTDKTVSVA